MTLLIWNVRGFNDPLKQKNVIDRIRYIKANIVCLLETRVKENKSQSIVGKYFKGWKYANNYVSAINGRIWFLWKGKMQVDLIDSMDKCITCSITSET